MAKGLDRREPVQDRLASMEEAQLSERALTPVMSPRPASSAGVGAGYSALSQSLRNAGSVLSAVSKKREQEDNVTGQIAFAQGKTLSELQAEGASRATIAGFQAIDAQTQASAMFADHMKRIEAEDHSIDPLDYRGVLGQRLREATEGLDPETSRLVSAHAAQQMPRLAEAQMRAHFAYRDKETFSSAVSMASTAAGDPSARDTIDFVFSTDPDSPLAALSPEKQSEAVTESILRAFAEDDASTLGLFEELGVLDRFKLTSQQRNSIRAAEQGYENRRRSEFNEELDKTNRQIVQDLEAGKISVEDALTRRAEALASHGLKMKRIDARDIYATDDNRRKALAQEEKKALEEARKAALEEIEGLNYGGFMLKKDRLKRDLNDGKITPAQYEAGVMEAHAEFRVAINKTSMGDLASDLIERDTKLEKDQARQDKIMFEVFNGNIVNLPEKDQQEAFELVEQNIGLAYGDAVIKGHISPEEAQERIREDFIDWSMNAGVVNKNAKRRMHAALTGDLLGKDGQPRPEVLQTVADFMTMHEKNPRMAEKYMTGDAEDVLAIIESNVLVTGDIENAVKAATTQLSQPDIRDRVDVIQSPETQAKIAQAAEDWIEDQSFSIVGALFRGDAELKSYFDVFSGEQDRALGQAGIVRQMIERQAEARMLRTRGMDPETAIRQAARDIEGRVALMGGDVVIAPKGKDIKTLMFGGRAPDFNVDNVENTALMTYLSEFGSAEEMWGEDFNGNTLSRIFLSGDGPSVLGVTIPDTIYNPAATVGAAVDAAREAARGVPEIRVSAVPSYSGQEPGVMVEYRRSDGSWNPDIRFVPYKDIGDFYIESRKAQFQ